MSKDKQEDKRLGSVGLWANVKQSLCICRSMKCQNMEGQTITILTLMISNALATKYSWIGRKGKMPFNLLAMSKIIIGAADRAGLSPNYKSTVFN
ncbi:hypothetical protein JTB14_012974 [Gonioctena quinquepunctata]|nr:hypothetical protein JTB14_012974 [Gonioctena quinquepunctata]